MTNELLDMLEAHHPKTDTVLFESNGSIKNIVRRGLSTLLIFDNEIVYGGQIVTKTMSRSRISNIAKYLFHAVELLDLPVLKYPGIDDIPIDKMIKIGLLKKNKNHNGYDIRNTLVCKSFPMPKAEELIANRNDIIQIKCSSYYERFPIKSIKGIYESDGSCRIETDNENFYSPLSLDKIANEYKSRFNIELKIEDQNNWNGLNRETIFSDKIWKKFERKRRIKRLITDE